MTFWCSACSGPCDYVETEYSTISIKVLNKYVKHILHALQAHMELTAPVLFVRQENILQIQAGVIVNLVLTVGYNPKPAKVLVFLAQQVHMMTKILKYAIIVVLVHTNRIRARLFVTSVHEVKSGPILKLAKIVHKASTSQKKAKQYVSTVKKEHLREILVNKNVQFVVQGHIRMHKGAQHAKIAIQGSFRLPLLPPLHHFMYNVVITSKTRILQLLVLRHAHNVQLENGPIRVRLHARLVK